MMREAPTREPGANEKPADPARVGGSVRTKRRERVGEMLMRQWIFVGALFMAGCGGPDLACDLVQKVGPLTSHMCSEIDGIDSTQADAAEQSCTALGGTLEGSCSSDGEVGICTVTQGDFTQSIHFYSEGGLTAVLAEQSCKSLNGTWTPS